MWFVLKELLLSHVCVYECVCAHTHNSCMCCKMLTALLKIGLDMHAGILFHWDILQMMLLYALKEIKQNKICITIN